MLLPTVLLSVLLAVVASRPPNATVSLTLLKDPLARCMDGTMGGYYFRKGAASNKWVLNLQGGGECVTSTRCAEKALTNLGSSKHFPATFTFWDEAAVHLSDVSCYANPGLCEYNQVYLPYCSQDLWSGQRTAPSNATFGFFFSGHHVLSAVVDDLVANRGLADASTLVLTGTSAGGFGVYLNVDWLAARLPTASVVGAPIAGFEFYAWPYQGPGHTSSSLADFRRAAMGGGAYNKLWNATVSPACGAAYPSEPGACLLPAFLYEHLAAPLFIMEAQSDSVVLMAHDWLPKPPPPPLPLPRAQRAYMAEFAANQTRWLAAAAKPESAHGFFNPACFIHTGFTRAITLADGNGGRLSYLEAFSRWLGGEAIRLADTCADGEVLCNPTC